MNDPIIEHLRKDPVLTKIIDRVGELEPTDPTESDLYFSLLRSIVSQQLSSKAASTIFQRFLNLFQGGYPHPETLLMMEIDHLRTAGLSNQKANYIKNVAQFFQEETNHNLDWHSLSDDAIIEKLTVIKGVGRWTVQMILMFTFQRPDILPLDDLAIRNNMMRLYEIEGIGRDLHQRLVEIAQPWQPYRTYACLYLWAFSDKGL